MKKRINGEYKFLLVFTIFWIVCAGIYFIVDYYLDEKAFEKSFESYTYYNIKENFGSNDLKSNLINDEYFVNFVLSDNYNGTLKTVNTKELFKYYLYYLNKNNKRIISVNSEEESVCIPKKYFYTSMKELFNVDRTDYEERLKFISFITVYKDNVCFKTTSLEGIDDKKYVGIKDISVDGDIINMNLYYYEFYSNEQNAELNVYNYLMNSVNNLTSFNDMFESVYNGKIIEKKIKFRELPNGKFFKYQLVLIESNI